MICMSYVPYLRSTSLSEYLQGLVKKMGTRLFAYMCKESLDNAEKKHLYKNFGMLTSSHVMKSNISSVPRKT